MENDDRITNQIEGLGNKRLLGCACWWMVLMLVGSTVLGLVIRHTSDKPIRTGVVLAFSGLLFGSATSILTNVTRRFLKTVFVVFPLVMAFVMFALSTLFGYAENLPLRMVVAPLSLTAGFLLGQFIWSYRRSG